MDHQPTSRFPRGNTAPILPVEVTTRMSVYVRMIHLLAVILLLVTGAAAGERAQPGDELAEIDRLLAAGRGAEAMARVEALSATHAEDPLYGWQLSERRGLALLLQDKPAAAMPLLEDAVRRHPGNSGHHRNLAHVLRLLGRRGRALAEYTQAVELAPLDADLRLELAQYLAEFGQWHQAEIEFRTAGSLGAGEDADRGLAVALMRQGKSAAAVEPLQRQYLAAPSPTGRRELAAALQASRRDSELVVLLAPVETEDLDASELMALIQAEGRLGGDPLRSREFAAQLDAGNPPSQVGEYALFWARAGLNLIAAEYWQAALTATTHAVRLEPGNVVFRNNRLVVLQHLGHDEEASREWDEILRLDPQRKEP